MHVVPQCGHIGPIEVDKKEAGSIFLLFLVRFAPPIPRGRNVVLQRQYLRWLGGWSARFRRAWRSGGWTQITPGPLCVGPLWGPWALMGQALMGPLGCYGPALMGLPGPVWAGPLGHYGPGPHGPPWASLGPHGPGSYLASMGPYAPVPYGPGPHAPPGPIF